MNIHDQSGVLPLRRRRGRTELLLITSTGGRKWIIPKGIIEDGMTAAESAEKEAWEEAGIRGSVDPEPFGTWSYPKWGGDCLVHVFRMTVGGQAERYPEAKERKRRWLPIEQAAAKVDDAGLRRLILALAATDK